MQGQYCLEWPGHPWGSQRGEALFAFGALFRAEYRKGSEDGRLTRQCQPGPPGLGGAKHQPPSLLMLSQRAHGPTHDFVLYGVQICGVDLT